MVVTEFQSASQSVYSNGSSGLLRTIEVHVASMKVRVCLLSPGSCFVRVAPTLDRRLQQRVDTAAGYIPLTYA